MKELIYHRQLLNAVERHADKRGFVDGYFSATFSEHLDRTLRIGTAMRDELGVSKGDRFAVMAGNGHRFLELYHAGFLGFGVVNPLNLRLAVKELAFILNDSETSVVFADFMFAGAIEAIRSEVPGLKHLVLMGGGDAPHDLEYEDLLVAAATPRLPEEPEEDDPVVLMYTGGTTGTPKGVLLDQRAEMLNLYHVAMLWGVDESMVYLHQTPMFHAASMAGVLAVPATGGTCVFIPFFSPQAALKAIEEHAVTTTVMVPTMIAMTVQDGGFAPEKLASLRNLTYGASPMPTTLLEQLLRTFPDLDIYQGYGMTEASAVLTILDAKDHRRGGDILRSAGRPVPGVAISIQDPAGKVLPRGGTGEVCARAGNFMREYWKRPEETEDAFRGGWYHTGDAGRLDEHGYLYLVDRVKDMIVTGGENVYSVEVENAIASHPAVAQVAVIGIPHDVWGEQVHAIVVLKPGAAATEDEIREHARASVAGYKLPKSVEFRAEPLPLSGAMKVLKKDLRAAYWEGRERSVN